jgi:hypothetical protein
MGIRVNFRIGRFLMNSLYHFVLVSRRDNDAQRIVTEISRNRLYSIEIVELAADVLNRLSQENVHCLAFNFNRFQMHHTKLFSEIRSIYNYPIVAFGIQADKDALNYLQQLPRAVFIEKPYEPKDVWGICQKILQGRPVNQRIFRRYYTKQMVSVQNSVNGQVVSGDILNLSRGGAYFEFEQGKLFPGDLLKVSINLDKLSKAYNVDAEVVWAEGHGNARKASAGLRFVRSHDIYRNFLNRL